ncbi:hypothetical protein LTR36_001406 [Oleoguttula mirabilis]|uniref:NmrA-like domain-containing protein n=1 Tax=Oleoguttula mirabilis TaxID=1507867 RepID=A0AAV9JPU4_9PEZI|nr:hypothetical protein LTR36_001406 [Oleoguttula mirabilis]
MAIKNVSILGADGLLGRPILEALLAAGFKVTVLKRQGSKSPDQYPESVAVARVPDDMPVAFLKNTLRGQDALVVAIKGTQTDVQKKLADACVAAGVKRFIPADFGSCDSSSELTQELVPLYKNKTELREYLVQAANTNSAFSWSSVVCGHFFDWSLEFVHIFLKERRADVLNDGEKKSSMATLARVGEVTARILQRPEQTANQMVYVQSFCVSQNEVIRAFEQATGEKWQVAKLDAEEFKDAEKAKADKGEKAALEELVWYLGAVDADWTKNEGFAMKILGLEDEDLQEAVDKVVQSHK